MKVPREVNVFLVMEALASCRIEGIGKNLTLRDVFLALAMQQYNELRAARKGAAMPKKRPPAPERELLARLYRDVGLRAIATQYGVSVRTVRNWVHEAGIEIRPRGANIRPKSGPA